MLTNLFSKIDKFYFIMVLVLVVVAVIVVYAFRGIFTSLATAYDVDSEISDTELRIDKNTLESAYNIVSEREIVKLEIR